LADEKLAIRQAAVVALGHMGPTAAEAVPRLTPFLRERNADLRRETIATLGQIGEPATPALIQALQDPEPKLREAAAKWLYKIGTPEALAALRDAGQQPK
jgi:HEAT repeat protein